MTGICHHLPVRLLYLQPHCQKAGVPGGAARRPVHCHQVFTVVCQVALASILAVWHGNGFTLQFVPDYLSAYCRNFLMALPLQLLVAGPIARRVFRAMFRRGEAQKN